MRNDIRRCPNCGTAAGPGDVFCGACGQPLPSGAKQRARFRDLAWFVQAGIVVVMVLALAGGYLIARSVNRGPGNQAILPIGGNTDPVLQCTPPACSDGLLYCPEEECPGGCGVRCATWTATPAQETVAATNTVMPTATHTVEPTETEQPTAPAPSTATTEPTHTATQLPPTETPLPPTATTVPPTATAIPPTATAIPPTDTPEPSPTETDAPPPTAAPAIEVVDRVNLVTQATGQAGPVWVEHRNGIMIQHPNGQWYQCELGFLNSPEAIAAFQQRWDWAARGGATWHMRIEMRKKVGWVSCTGATCSEKQAEGSGEIYVQVHYTEDVWRSLLNSYVAGGLEEVFRNEHYYPAQDEVLKWVHGDLARTPIIGLRFTPKDSPW